MRPTRPTIDAHAPDSGQRPGVVILLTAAMLVMLFGFLAFSVDIGYMSIVNSELQSAVDAAALAGTDELANGTSEVIDAAQFVAGENEAGNEAVALNNSDVIEGEWDLATRTFTPGGSSPNAVRVEGVVADRPLFFAPVIGHNDFDVSASAIAMVNPRDIIFVVDLSGSMNDDTEIMAAEGLDLKFAGTSSAGIGTRMANDLFNDMGFGDYPGYNAANFEYIGNHIDEYLQSRGVSNGTINGIDEIGLINGTGEQNYYAFAVLTAQDGPLARPEVEGQYRIEWGHTEAQRRERAYRWIVDHQLKRLMPNATPAPDWRNAHVRALYFGYLDFIQWRLWTQSFWNLGQPRRHGRFYSFASPEPEYWHNRFYSHFFTSTSRYPDLSSTEHYKYIGKLGYDTFMKYQSEYGRERSFDRPNPEHADLNNGRKVPYSTFSQWTPYHNEDVDGETFTFPPRQQPLHACRRSIIRALQLVEEKNEFAGEGAADRVAIVTYDGQDAYHAPELRLGLTYDYDAAKESTALMQEVGGFIQSTATENALKIARTHFDSHGRNNATQVVILLTDGLPNLYNSSESEIDAFINDFNVDNPGNSDFYSTGGNYAGNGALIQASRMFGENTILFGLGFGLGADKDFLDRLARLAGTDENGNSPELADDPAQYEQVLVEVLEQIIDTAGARLVQ